MYEEIEGHLCSVGLWFQGTVWWYSPLKRTSRDKIPSSSCSADSLSLYLVI